MKCSKCGSRDIDFQESTGQSICISCGTVLEESTIVSSIEFQESGDRSHVIGQYVAANCTKPYLSGSRIMNRHIESRDTALINARRIVSQLASSLKLPSLYVDRAYRLFQLALQRNLIFGRRQTHLVATCLYIICRQEKSPFLLIDFSDILQINVFVLGRAFLQFANVLNINLPIVDPSLYIHRYAGQFDFSDRQASVITTSLRIITRLKKDWIVTGRRPDGVCAAALLLAARAHGFDISHEAVATIFRIANVTVRKRLLEFKQTPSAQLNLLEFHQTDATAEYDPPAFIHNILQANDDIDITIEGETQPPDAKDLVNDDVYKNLSSDEEAEEVEGAINIRDIKHVGDSLDNGESDSETASHREGQLLSNSLERDGASSRTVATNLAGRLVHVPVPALRDRRKPSQAKQMERIALYDSIYSEVFQSSSQSQQRALQKEAQELEHEPDRLGGWGMRGKGRTLDRKLVLVVPVSSKDKKPPLGSNTTDSRLEMDKDQNDEGVAPLSDTEVASYIFTEEERAKRTVIWDSTFGSFMEERARRKRERDRTSQDYSGDRYTETGKLRKKYSKRATGKGATTSEAVLSSTAASSRVSKNINYDALKGMFGNDGAFAFPAAADSGSQSRKEKIAAAASRSGNKLGASSSAGASSGVSVASKAAQGKAVGADSSSKAMPATGAGASAAARKELPAQQLENDYDEDDEDMLLYEGDGADNQDDYDYEDEYY